MYIHVLQFDQIMVYSLYVCQEEVLKLRKNTLLLFFSTIILAIVSLTVAGIATNLTFYFSTLTATTAVKTAIAEIVALILWWLLNKTYLKVKINWHISTRDSHWLFLLPIIVVLIGDSTLKPHFSFSLTNTISAIILGLTVALFEEYIFRGILVNYLYSHFRLSVFWTASLSGIAFSLVHLINALDGNIINTVAQAFAALALGFFLAVIYLITNNLWLPIIAHAIVDVFDQLAFGTLSNTAGTSMLTGIIYTIFYLLIGILLLAKFSPSANFSRDTVTVSFRPKDTLSFSTPVDTTQIKVSPIKTIIAIIIPPLELLIGPLAIKLVSGRLAKSIVMDLVFFIGFVTAILLYKNVLKLDWQRFKQRWFVNLLLAIGGVIVSYLILIGARLLLRPLLSAGGASVTDSLSVQGATVGLIASLTVLMAPFTEEIIFRHVLFYQWKKRGIFTWLMFIISAVLFGLAHWNNFNGNVLAMIPYMLVGAWYALIYYWSRDIWQNILTHFLFDVIQFLSALIVLLAALLQ